MGNTFVRRVALKSAILFTALLTCAPAANGATKHWNAGGSGLWNVAANWNAGVPGEGDAADLTLTDSGDSIVTYDYTGPDVTLSSVSIVWHPSAVGNISPSLTLAMSTHNLITNDEYIANGTGQLSPTTATSDVSGGVNTINNKLYLGFASGDQGTYKLRGSAEIFATTSTEEVIGVSGTGTFTQSGTSINRAQILNLGAFAGSSGTYTLGTQLADNASILTHDEYIGNGGTASFTQNSGSNTVTGGIFDVAEFASSSTSVYTLNGGSLSAINQRIGVGGIGSLIQGGNSTNNVGSLTIGVFNSGIGTYRLGGNATLSLTLAGIEIVGNSGTGNFIQTGGSNQLNGNGLYIGENNFSNGAYAMSGGVLSAGEEYVGHFGTGTFIQTLGTNTVNGALYIGNTSAAIGTYTLGGPATSVLSVNANVYVGNSATGNGTQTGGTFTQSGGKHSIVGVNSSLYLGNSSGATGTYNLSNTGQLTVGGNEFVGFGGAGTFNQTGGTNTVSDTTRALYVGDIVGAIGTYNLGGTGLLTVNGDEYVGFTGSGMFTQSGGEHDVTSLGAGKTFNLGRNVGSMGTYSLSGNGVLFVIDGDENIGFSGTGNFNQTGGQHIVQNKNLLLGVNAGAVGNYTLTGGSVTTNNNAEYVGKSGTGHFAQTGGTNNPNGSAGLTLGDNSSGVGTYDISGGHLDPRKLIVGNGGSGTFNQIGGDVYIDSGYGRLVLGKLTGSSGTYNISAGTLEASDNSFIDPLDDNGPIIVGDDGTGVLNQTGGTITAGAMEIGLGGNGTAVTGTYAISGGSANIISNVANSGGVQVHAGLLAVTGTGVLTTSRLLVGSNLPGGGVNLAGGTINTSQISLSAGPQIFHWTGGTLNITNDVAWDPNGIFGVNGPWGGSLTIGNSQTFGITGSETLSLNLGSFALTLNSGSTHSVGSDLVINSLGTLTRNPGSTLTYGVTFRMQGGTFNGTLDSLTTFQYDSGIFNGRLINKGAVGITGNFVAGNGVENDANITLVAGQTLTANGAGLDNQSVFNLNGGLLTGNGPQSNSGNLFFNAGSLSTTAGFTNQVGGQFIVPSNVLATVIGAFSNVGELNLGSQATTISGTGTLTNTGIIRGEGIISKSFANNTGGEIRAEFGKRLKFTGSVSPNAGHINLLNGSVEFSQALTNGPTGQILGVGLLTVGGAGLTNNGQVLLSGGVTYVYGDVNNNTGSATKGITVTGNADVAFWDDMTNTGVSQFKVSSGSSATFFGSYGGTGTTGGGDLHFEADLSPGSSPATVTFDNHVVLGSTAVTKIELGGTTLGQFDQLHINGKFELDGTLQLSLIDGFAPAAGNSFDILDWTTLSGTFTSLTLPSLSGLAWDTSQLYNTGVIRLTSSGILGDYNHNGVVDAADYVVWRKTDGTPEAYNIWRAHFGQTIGSGSASQTAAVPEPPTLVSLCLGAVVLVSLRRDYFSSHVLVPFPSRPGG
jgi:hypothetical protein